MRTKYRMSEDDVAKLKAVILYILDKCGEIDFIHLSGIIYFAERCLYSRYGQHLINDSFIAMEHGPVPSYLYKSLQPAIWSFVKANKKLDLDELSHAEIAALDEAIAEYKDTDTKAWAEMSHDTAWHSAWEVKHNSVMSSLKIAKAGGASDVFLEYLKEQETIDSLLKA